MHSIIYWLKRICLFNLPHIPLTSNTWCSSDVELRLWTKLFNKKIMHVHKGSCENLFIFCLFRQFMSDARDCESYLRQLQETIKRQYTCDKNSRLSKLEDLLQDSMVSTALQLPSSVFISSSDHRKTLWTTPSRKKNHQNIHIQHFIIPLSLSCFYLQ